VQWYLTLIEKDLLNLEDAPAEEKEEKTEE
jgi:hypothetical protein